MPECPECSLPNEYTVTIVSGAPDYCPYELLPICTELLERFILKAKIYAHDQYGNPEAICDEDRALIQRARAAIAKAQQTT